MWYNGKSEHKLCSLHIRKEGERSMKVAIIGSRKAHADHIERYLPDGVTEIVTGGAKGVDADAMRYAQEKGLKLTVFEPRFHRYRKGAPLVRNREIVAYADCVIAFWDGVSRGTAYSIGEAEKQGKPLTVVRVES